MNASPSELISHAAVEHLRWSLTPEVGPVLFGRLMNHFGSAARALGASVTQLEQVEGIGRTISTTIARHRDNVPLEAELALAERHGVRIICREDDEYPPGLKHIPDAPICLYVKGRIEKHDAIAIGLVGARRCTIYGHEQARRFGDQLGARGLTVISGLARGIDGEAHKGALESGGRTIAVLGNGLATIYPPEHAELAGQIIQNGAVISELPMNVSPESKNFLPRNRIIAGMSLGVLVIEAARRSGSLTTARLAIEYNREVFALPGRIDSEFSSGTNLLIRDQSAKLVMGVDDIIDELGEVSEPLRAMAPAEPELPLLASAIMARLNKDERLIFDSLDAQGQSIEVIADVTECTPSRVASILLTLQIKGLARQLPGNMFVRAGGGK